MLILHHPDSAPDPGYIMEFTQDEVMPVPLLFYHLVPQSGIAPLSASFLTFEFFLLLGSGCVRDLHLLVVALVKSSRVAFCENSCLCE